MSIKYLIRINHQFFSIQCKTEILQNNIILNSNDTLRNISSCAGEIKKL